MKFTSALGLLSLASSLPSALAATWYFIEWNPSASGQYFTTFNGTMQIPSLPQAGTYYLWPGLQPTDNSGVYQNVLDGRSGTWWIGSGWCCSNPSLPWGGGFNVDEGDSVFFGNAKGDDTWTSTLIKSSDGSTVSNDFALADKSFDQAIFAIELDGVSWDFGSLTFNDVVIVAEGSSDSSWCNDSPTNYNSAAVISVSGATASVSGTTVTCNIATAELVRPA